MARTKTGTPPSYRLHKPTGRAVVTIDGRDIYLGQFGTEESKRQYGLLLAGDAVPKAKREPVPAAEPTTLAVVLLAIWKHAQRAYVKSGRRLRQQTADSTRRAAWGPDRAGPARTAERYPRRRRLGQ